ncbi:hypothetical protein N431DRAFT_10710 [Stipitochalara longipes BDJ]|nr:hypothetical protein N431DRAFT_10710 [Stipitochalara longipes BDJ]
MGARAKWQCAVRRAAFVAFALLSLSRDARAGARARARTRARSPGSQEPKSQGEQARCKESGALVRGWWRKEAEARTAPAFQAGSKAQGESRRGARPWNRFRLLWRRRLETEAFNLQPSTFNLQTFNHQPTVSTARTKLHSLRGRPWSWSCSLRKRLGIGEWIFPTRLETAFHLMSWRR